MTNQQHPITPPENLLQQLRHNMGTWLDQITIAYQAGANQELEACCKWLKIEGYPGTVIDLRAARRPKPPSLKEQALQVLASAPLNADEHALIRQALEALPND